MLILILSFTLSISSIIHGRNWANSITFILCFIPLYLSLVSLFKIPKIILVIKYVCQQTLLTFNRRWGENFILNGVIHGNKIKYFLNNWIKCCAKNGILECKFYTNDEFSNIYPQTLKLNKNEIIYEDFIKKIDYSCDIYDQSHKGYIIYMSKCNTIRIQDISASIIYKSDIRSYEKFKEFIIKDINILISNPTSISDGLLHRLTFKEKIIYALENMDINGNIDKEIKNENISKPDFTTQLIYITILLPIIIIKLFLLMLITPLTFTIDNEISITILDVLCKEISEIFQSQSDTNLEGNYWVGYNFNSYPLNDHFKNKWARTIK